MTRSREFLGGPVVRTLLSSPRVWVDSLVRELRFHKLWDMAKNNKIKKKKKKEREGKSEEIFKY